MSTSPLEREILQHYYCLVGPYGGGEEKWSPSVRSAVDRFLNLGLLIQCLSDVPGGGSYIKANDQALKPYMEALSNVPLPVQKWVIP